MAQHSAAYARAKAAGEFARPAGALGERCRPCKTDAIKLCTWHASRKLGLKDPHGAFIRAHRARGHATVKRIVRSLSRGVDPAISLHKWGLHMLDTPIVVDRKLGQGVGGSVYMVHEDVPGGETLAMKVVHSSAMDDFDHEVHMQKVFSKLLLAPKVKLAYVYRGTGVVLMDPIQSVMSTVLAKVRFQNKRKGGMRHLAGELKRVTQLLGEHKLCHGDLHMSNLGYQLRRGVPRLVYIDFGRAFRYPAGGVGGWSPQEVDRFWVWRSMQLKYRWSSALYKAMLSVGFPKSQLLEQEIGTGKPDPATSGVYHADIENLAGGLLDAQFRKIANTSAPRIHDITYY